MNTRLLKYPVLLTLLAGALSACTVGVPIPQSQSRNMALEDVRSDMKKKRQNVKMINEPGMIHIQRQTDEYSISMVLDASDENIYFVMDLPKEEEELATDKLEEPVMPEPEEPPAEPELPTEEQVAEAPPEEAEPEEKAMKPEQELDETRASKYVLYAQTYFLEKKYARALEEVNRALGYSPNSAVAHSLRGSIYYKLGDKELARGAWTRALELDASLDNVKKMLSQLEKEK